MLAACLTAACDRKSAAVALPQPDRPAAPASAVPAPNALQAWLGQWNGPEDAYLQLIARPDAKYEIIIKNQSGERSFEGVSGIDHIYFERDGTVEKLRSSDGAGTGVKALADKSRCLTIRPGEGFCRG